MTVPMVVNKVALSKRKLIKGLIGIEIEVEGRNLFNPKKWWRTEHDGSLQDGIEYVLEKPLSLDDAKRALTYFARSATLNKSELRDSVRAGVHVHINVQDFTMLELYNMITMYLVFEGVLTDICGDGRQGNLFCLRSTDAEYLVHEIRRKAIGCSANYNDSVRYSSINLASLRKYGSVEFRAMRTPIGPTKAAQLLAWVKLLVKLKEGAVKYENPQQMLESYSDGGGEQFMRDTFGDLSSKLTKVPNWRGKLREGILFAQDVAYSNDWSKYGDVEELNPFKKRVEF